MQIEAGLDGTLFTEWQYNAEPIKFDAKLCYGVHIDVGFKKLLRNLHSVLHRKDFNIVIIKGVGKEKDSGGGAASPPPMSLSPPPMKCVLCRQNSPGCRKNKLD